MDEIEELSFAFLILFLLATILGVLTFIPFFVIGMDSFVDFLCCSAPYWAMSLMLLLNVIIRDNEPNPRRIIPATLVTGPAVAFLIVMLRVF